jgi:hypothetical protein
MRDMANPLTSDAQPIGSLMYSNAFSDNNSTYEQVIQWHLFIGGN